MKILSLFSGPKPIIWCPLDSPQ